MRRTIAAVLAVLCLTLPAAVQADDAPSSALPTSAPRSFVVALTLASPRLQAGAVRGQDVILARGFEVELARILARRLGGRVDRFVYTPFARRHLASSLSGWDLALGGIEPGHTAGSAGDVSRPYLSTDVAVVARRGLVPPRRLAGLRRLVVCAVRGSDAAGLIAARVRPRRAPLLVQGPERLQTVLRTGVCDAAVVPAFDAGRFVEGRRRAMGAVVGRIEHRRGYGILVRRGTGLEVTAVDHELARMEGDGTLGRLARAWLGFDPATLRVFR